MNKLSFKEFDNIYQNFVKKVYTYWTPQMQTEIAFHCQRYAVFDFKTYLEASSIRFYKAYCAIAEVGERKTVWDVGGFWSVFPLTLKKLGFDVTMTESLQYYSNSFNDLFNFIAENGVIVMDYDPFLSNMPLKSRFDAITVLAILEHYPHSLKIFMKNIISSMKPDGKVYLEVPNIAFWPKRINLLYGRTPLTQLKDIYLSEVPFIGHHHEFTISELRDLINLAGLTIISEDFYNYSPGSIINFRMLRQYPFRFLIYKFLKDSRECLAVLCRLDAD